MVLEIPDGIYRLANLGPGPVPDNPDIHKKDWATAEGDKQPIRVEPPTPPYVEHQQVWLYHRMSRLTSNRNLLVARQES